VIGIEAVDADRVRERHGERDRQEAFVGSGALLRSPAAGAARRQTAVPVDDDSGHGATVPAASRVLWSYSQATAIEFQGEALVLGCAKSGRPGVLSVHGIALFRMQPQQPQQSPHQLSAPEAAAAEALSGGERKPDGAIGSSVASNGVLVRGRSVWLHDCTISLMNGRGACLTLAGSRTSAVLTCCVLSSAPSCGVVVAHGAALALQDSDVVGCGAEAVRVEDGAFLARRCTFLGNAAAVVVVAAREVEERSEAAVTTARSRSIAAATRSGPPAVVALEGCDLCGNAESGRATAAALQRALPVDRLRLENCLLLEKDTFDPDPFVAVERADAAQALSFARRHGGEPEQATALGSPIRVVLKRPVPGRGDGGDSNVGSSGKRQRAGSDTSVEQEREPDRGGSKRRRPTSAAQ
jgi:hypothetical protein